MSDKEAEPPIVVIDPPKDADNGGSMGPGDFGRLLELLQRVMDRKHSHMLFTNDAMSYFFAAYGSLLLQACNEKKVSNQIGKLEPHVDELLKALHENALPYPPERFYWEEEEEIMLIYRGGRGYRGGVILVSKGVMRRAITQCWIKRTGQPPPDFF